MAKKTKSSVFERVGKKAQKAFDKNKSKPVEMGSGNLPPNVEGVAVLDVCCFRVAESGYYKGKDQFYAVGTVVEPKEHAGRKTFKTEVIADTSSQWGDKSVEQHLERVMNELKKLGIDMADMEYDDLEDAMEALVESDTHFNFSTWKPDGENARVQHQWNGAIDYDSDNEDDDDDMVDETEDDDEEIEDDEDDEDDDDEDEDEEIEDDEDDIHASQEPEINDPVNYKPPRKRKPINCTVVKVFPKKQTVTLKGDNGETYKGVGWDELDFG